MNKKKEYTARQKFNLLQKWWLRGGRREDAECVADRRNCSVSSLYAWQKAFRFQGKSGLRNKSKCPHTPHPTAHTAQELASIAEVISRYPNKSRPYWHGVLRAEYGYTRSFDGMCHRIRLDFLTPRPKLEFERRKRPPLPTIGIEAQVDVKYVPLETMAPEMYSGYLATGARLYQYTMIDCCSREVFAYFDDGFGQAESVDFLHRAHLFFGHRFHYIRTDQGREFTNDLEEKQSLFSLFLEKLGTEYIINPPRSPWRNGMVERVHRTFNEEFYYDNIKSFSSLEDLRAKGKSYLIEYNTIRTHSALRSATGQRYITPQQKRDELLAEIKINNQHEIKPVKQNRTRAEATRSELFKLPEQLVA